MSASPNIAVPLESVLCTEQLDRRPSRPPDYQAENGALVSLAQALADSPRTILQTLADTILEVFRCESAGVSLVTEDGERFHWPAIAGVWTPHIGGGTPREFGPCGDVLDRNMPLLFSHFERRYSYLQAVMPPAEECLLVPFYVRGKAVGTIWAITHDPGSRTFDNEDLRMLVSLGTFASAAYQAVEQSHAIGAHAQERRADADALREMNQTLLVSSVRQHELAEQACQAESAVRRSEEGLQQALDDRTAELGASHQRLRLSDRMAAVGTLAAGLAHDIDNLLLPLSLRMDVLLTDTRVEAEVHTELVVITALLDHLRQMSRSLAQFSRDPEKEGITGRTDLARWYTAVHGLLDASVGREIIIRWDCPEGLPEVAIASHRLTQAVQNLVHNARDAIVAARSDEPQRMGRIAVEARSGPAPGSVVVKVIDNGTGMDEEVRQHCLEPFYTKAPAAHKAAPGRAVESAGGGGSGLGLSLAHGIVKRAGGRFDIESQPGEGTTITMTFPPARPGDA